MLRVVGLVVFAGSGRSAAAPTNAIAAAAAAPEGLQVLKNAETFPEEPQARVLVVSAGRSGAGLVGAILNRAPGLPFYVHEPCRAMASDTLPPPPSSALTISLSSSQSSLPPSPSSKLIPGPSTCTALLARVLHCNFTPGDAAAHLFSFPEDVAESQALSAIADPAWPAGPAALSVRRQHERDGSDGSKRLTPEGERHAGAVAACRAASLVVVVSDIARLVGTASHASNSSKAKQLKMQASNAARQPEAGGAGAGLSELLGGGIATHLLHVVRHPIAAAYSRLTDPAPLLAPGLGPTAAPGDEGSSARGDPCVVARRGERAVIQRLSLDACARRACAAAAASNDAVKAAAAAHRRSHQRDPSNHSGDGDVSGGGTGATGGAAVANKRAARHGDADDDANLEVVGALVHRVERSSTARRVRGTGWVPPASERVAKVSALGAVAELQFEALARDPVAGTQVRWAAAAWCCPPPFLHQQMLAKCLAGAGSSQCASWGVFCCAVFRPFSRGCSALRVGSTTAGAYWRSNRTCGAGSPSTGPGPSPR